MKNVNYLLVMILSVTVSVSCSNDYDDDNISYSANEYDNDNVSYRALVGTWEGAELEDDVRIIKTVTFNEDLSGCFLNYLQLHENGNMLLSVEDHCLNHIRY